MFQRVGVGLRVCEFAVRAIALRWVEIEESFCCLLAPFAGVSAPIPVPSQYGDPSVRGAAVTCLDGSLITLCVGVIAVGNVLTQQRDAAALFMEPKSLGAIFGVFEPGGAVLLPVDVLGLV